MACLGAYIFSARQPFAPQPQGHRHSWYGRCSHRAFRCTHSLHGLISMPFALLRVFRFEGAQKIFPPDFSVELSFIDATETHLREFVQFGKSICHFVFVFL